MAEHQIRLSEKSIIVLEMVAAGSTYDQILTTNPHLTYMDIFAAAQEALDCLAGPKSKAMDRYSEIRRSYPRAYEKWTGPEEQRLGQMISNGLTVAQIASRLQRQRSAIRSRIIRLNLVEELNPRERGELIRISKLDPVNGDPSAEK